MVFSVGWLSCRWLLDFFVVVVCFPLGPCLNTAKREVAGNTVNLVGLQEPNNA